MFNIDFSDNVLPVAENILTLVDDGSYTNEELVGGLTRAILIIQDEEEDSRVVGEVIRFLEEQ